MATHIGIISNLTSTMPLVGTITKNRSNKYRVGVIVTPFFNIMPLVGTITKIRANRYRIGVNLYTYNNDIYIKRKPREHILNKYALVNGNIRL